MSKNFKEFVETLEILKDVQCFWGKMSREEAKQILADKPIGSYLIFEIIVIDKNRGIQNFEMIEKCKYPRQRALFMGSDTYKFCSLISLNGTLYIYKRNDRKMQVSSSKCLSHGFKITKRGRETISACEDILTWTK